MLSTQHSTHHDRRWLAWLQYATLAIVTALALVFVNTGSVVQAQAPYPPFLDPHVNDYGQVLTKSDAATMRSLLRRFRADTGIHAVVVTVNSIDDYRTGDATIESFATNLFNTWRIGDRIRNDGVLILVAPGDRQVRIELGKGYDASQGQRMWVIIQERMIPKFQQGEVSQGTLDGTRAVVSQLSQASQGTGFMSELPGRAFGLFGSIWRFFYGLFTSIVSFGLGAIALVGGGIAWWRYRYQVRHGPRHCRTCQTEMVRLDEQSEDPYLTAGQRCEESVKSIDYDVWRCPSCEYRQVIPYTRFSAYENCPSCRHKTVKVTRQTIHQPTYQSEGQAEVTKRCQHCSYNRVSVSSIPRLTHDDDHSSGGSGESSDSGGGGQSSGGGATGSW